MTLTDDQRYIRQQMLPQIGPRGQEALARACVLIAGVGGLGSISAMYLAAAGVGHLVIADGDTLEISNLNRQIIHSELFLGKLKVDSAVRRLKDLNSTVRVTPVPEKLTHATIDSILNGVNMIVDGCDTYETRQVLNRASIRHHLPFVYGGVNGFDGMVSTFMPGNSPCFECVISKTTPQDTPVGVIGPAAGMTASLQAMETIKVLLGIGTPLESRLLRITGLDMRVQCLGLTPNPDCLVCC